MIREVGVAPSVDQRGHIRDLAEARAYVRTRPPHERRALAGAVEWCQVVPLPRLPQAWEYRHG
jgi:hypothetical protein